MPKGRSRFEEIVASKIESGRKHRWDIQKESRKLQLRSMRRLCRMCHEFPWPKYLRGWAGGIYAMQSVVLPFLSGVVLSLGTELMLRNIWSDKIRLLENRGHLCKMNHLAILWKERAAVWLILARFLIERPYVSRSSSAQFGHHRTGMMASACAGLSCMTSHGVGMCLCHSFHVEMKRFQLKLTNHLKLFSKSSDNKMFLISLLPL